MGKINWGKHSYGDLRIIGGTKGTINIGKYCSLGENVRAFMSHDHKIDNISTFPFGKIFKDIPRNTYRNEKKLEINIGNDVFIGSHAVIFTDVTIGDGAAIGAFSVITKDVKPYSVVVGNDRVVDQRFDKEIIELLLNLKWWDFEEDKIKCLAPILCSSNIHELRSIYEV